MRSTGEGGGAHVQAGYPDFSAGIHTAAAPVMVYNGLVTYKPNRRAPSSDADFRPIPYRRFVNVGVKDVQLGNGMRWKTRTGRRMNFRGSSYLWGSAPVTPGQMRDNVAGFHRRGPSSYNIQDIYDNGPGSQPEHPGGPGTIAGPALYNPMTGL